jgi:hypothetical protein
MGKSTPESLAMSGLGSSREHLSGVVVNNLNHNHPHPHIKYHSHQVKAHKAQHSPPGVGGGGGGQANSSFIQDLHFIPPAYNSKGASS